MRSIYDSRCYECGYHGSLVLEAEWRLRRWVRRYCLWNARWVARPRPAGERVVNMTQVFTKLDPDLTSFRTMLMRVGPGAEWLYDELYPRSAKAPLQLEFDWDWPKCP